MVTALGILFIFTPIYILPALVIAAAGAWIGQIYVNAQLSVKREMSAAKAPVLSILDSAITGLRTSLTHLRSHICLTQPFDSIHSSIP